MESIYFWKDWNKGYKNAYKAFLLVFAIGIVLSGYLQIFGIDYAIPLEQVRKTESINISLHDVNHFVFDLPVPARNYIILQGYLAPSQQISVSWSFIYLGVIILILAFIAAAATYFSRLWFLIFQSIFVIWIITLKMPFLNLFGIEGSLFNIIFAGLFLGLGYLFHAFKPDNSLLKKWLSFLLLMGLMLFFIVSGTEQPQPLLFIAQHAIIIPILLSMLFIGNVAYDVLLHIVYLIANKKSQAGQKINFVHFIVLSLLYLGYVTLTYARNAYLIKWDIIYLDEFFLLSVSAIFGIWGFKKRSELINEQLSFAPLGAYLYLALGIICFSTLSWIFITANDPLIDVFEDTIIFTHLGFGVLFIFYIVFNFIPLFFRGLNVYEVVFKPLRIPYNLVRFGGLALIAIMFLRVSYAPYFQALAGYYSATADYYQHIDKKEAANTSFKIAKQYAATTHKTNFNLGLNSYNDEDWIQAAYYFGRANYKRPSVQAYLNRAQAQLNANLVFEALFTLQSAQQKFPDNGFILNMEGLVYERLNKTDSSFLYFDAAGRAASNNIVEEVAKANKLGLFAKNAVQDVLPSDDNLSTASIPYRTNYLALANSYRASVEKSLFIEENDSALSYNDFSLIFNQVLNNSLKHILDQVNFAKFRQYKANEPFVKSLNYSAAFNKNYAGLQKEAYGLIYNLQNEEISDAGYYYLTQGMWLMDQQAYNLAEEKFALAEKLKMSKATTLRVIALIKAGRLYEAGRIYEKQFIGNTVNRQLLFEDPLYQFLNGSVDSLPDNFRYLWLATNKGLTADEKNDIRNKLHNSSFYELLTLDSAENLIHDGLYEKAMQLIAKVSLDKEDSMLTQHQYNLMAVTHAFMNTPFSNKSPAVEELSIYPYNYKLLMTAARAAKQEDSLANLYMQRLGNENVFFEQGVLLASAFFVGKQLNEAAYEILVDAARLNPNSSLILKAYGLQALRMSLRGYANDALNELASILSKEEYEAYRLTFDELQSRLDSDDW